LNEKYEFKTSIQAERTTSKDGVHINTLVRKIEQEAEMKQKDPLEEEKEEIKKNENKPIEINQVGSRVSFKNEQNEKKEVKEGKIEEQKEGKPQEIKVETLDNQKELVKQENPPPIINIISKDNEMSP